MLDQGNRTFIGSVCFIDIVGYSRKSVSEQIAIKDRFTALLSESLKDVALDQRIILDTGDGAAISFLGDPEDALFVSMHMRDYLQREQLSATPVTDDTLPISIINNAAIANELALRIGINLGPVKLIRDINGQPNIVGDGINVAQRIMSFANPAQIVVSRSFYDVVSVISDEYAKLFHYEGSRTDKHVREHEIYIVGESAAAFDQAKAGMVDRAATTNTKVQMGQAGISSGAFSGQPSTGAASLAVSAASAESATTDVPDTSTLGSKKKLILIAAMGLVAVALTAALAMKKTAKTDASTKPIDVVQPSLSDASKLQSGKSDIAPNSVIAPSASNVGVNTPAQPAPDATTPAVTGQSVANAQPDSPAGTAVPDIVPAAPATSTASTLPKVEPIKATGIISVSVDPWGEVFINGKSYGASPPFKQTKLAPGKYKIEIKNPDSGKPSFVTSIDLKSNTQAAVRHSFK